MNKRSFIKSSLLATFGLSLPAKSGIFGWKNMAAPLSIVDTHLHLWDLQAMDYPWLEGADNPLGRNFLLPHFNEASSRWPISKMVFVECARLPEQYLQEVDWVVKQAQSDPRLKGMVAYFPLELGKEAMPQLEELVSREIVRGVRKPLMAENAQFLKGVGLLAQYNLSYDLNVGPGELGDALDLVKKFPNLIFILNHIGNPDIKGGDFQIWSNRIKAFSSLENVNCKISGMITKADPLNWAKKDLSPYFDTILETFGMDRVVYGGDWPVVLRAGSYDEWMAVFLQLSEALTENEKMKLYRKNAERLYRI